MLALATAVVGRACCAMAARAGLCMWRGRCADAGAVPLSGAPHRSRRFRAACPAGLATPLWTEQHCCGAAGAQLLLELQRRSMVPVQP